MALKSAQNKIWPSSFKKYFAHIKDGAILICNLIVGCDICLIRSFCWMVVHPSKF